ncbi:MAG: site-specific integrase [bacterium]|nr:site-specific integrase [bacterium]
MTKTVTVKPRWYGPVPTDKDGNPLPSNRWIRAGRTRKWAVRWFAPDGSRPRKTFDAKADANAFARHCVAEFESRGALARVRPRRVTLGDFVAELVKLRTGPRGQRMSIKTLREYRCILERFSVFVGPETPLEAVAMSDATRYLAGLRNSKSKRTKRRLSPESVNKHKRNLKSAFNVAVMQLRYLTINPFVGLREDPLPDHKVRYVTPDEYRDLLAACETTTKPLWWRTFLAVCYTIGARTDEAVHLTWADIDFENDAIQIIAKPSIAGVPAWQPKDREARTIPAPVSTMRLLAEMHADAPEGHEFVFIPQPRALWIKLRTEAGKWVEGQAVINNLGRDFGRLAVNAIKARRQAAVEDQTDAPEGSAESTDDEAPITPDLTPHDLRRSCISHWARKLAAPVVQKLAGHSSIQTTLRYYVDVSEADLLQAREVCTNALLTDPKPTQIG